MQTFTHKPQSLCSIADLKNLPQWVCYSHKSKCPLNPQTGKGADCNDPTTWGAYEQARTTWAGNKSWYAGLGFEFVKEQGITGVDLDKCVIDGKLTDFAERVIRQLNSYTEYSPSSTGIHIWVRGNIPDNLKADGDLRIEMYDHERYFTVTGKHVAGTPETIEDRQEQLVTLYNEIYNLRKDAKNAKDAKENAKLHKNKIPGGDTPYGLAALSDECHEVASCFEGSRNERLNRAAFAMGQLIAGNELSRLTVENDLYTAAEQNGLAHREIERTMRSGIEAGMRVPRSSPIDDLIYGSSPKNETPIDHNKESDLQFILKCLEEGEYGDSRLFTRLFREHALYDHTAQEWYLWAGHWWKCDETGKIKHLVSGKLAGAYLKACVALNMQATKSEAEAELTGNTDGVKQRVATIKTQIKELTTRAFSLRQVSRSKNVLYFASSHDGMGISSSKWDANPWVLGVPNGVIDLRTGELRDGKAEDYIRTTSPTIWKGIHEPAHRWEQFLQEIFADRTEEERALLINFLQRMLGYGITGEVIEHIFAVFYGEDGRNGKDTVQKAITETLGSASGAIHKDVLLDAGRGHSAGAPTPHLSDLQGRRLAWASEPEKGARFNVGQIKELSGGGDIATRGLHEKKISKMKPSHLLLLLTNHKPHADANDTAFWDRLRLVTFNIRFVDNPKATNERKKDMTLWSKLRDETSGILAWLVRGCLEWQDKGLDTPQSVLVAGTAYRDEEDTLKTFLDECCVAHENTKVKASAVYEAYKTWAQAGNLYVMNKTVFGKELGKKKFAKTQNMHGIFYQGLGLLSDQHEESMNSSKNYSYGTEAASQAALPIIEEASHEQYEQFQQVFTKMGVETSDSRDKPVYTIHTIHSGEKKEPLDQPVEPSQDSMNSSDKLFIDLSTMTCSTRFDMMLMEPHEPAPDEDGIEIDPTCHMWCSKCKPQYDLMVLGAERGYPEVKNKKRVAVKAGQEHWLSYARTMGHQYVSEALKLAQQK